MRVSHLVGLLAPLMFLASPVAVAAPSPFMLEREFEARPEIAYRFQHPHFASARADVSLFTGMHEFSLAAPAGANSTIRIAMPLVKFSVDGYDLDDETSWGNLMVGFQSRTGTAGSLLVGCNFELPTAQTTGFDLLFAGLASHPASLTAFMPDVFSIRPYIQTRTSLAPETIFRFRLGPDLLLPVGDNDGEGEVLMDYGFGVGVESSMLAFSVEFGGLWLITGDGGSFGENSQHVLTAGIEVLGTAFAPGLYYIVPTDEAFDDLLDGVLGLRFRVLL